MLCGHADFLLGLVDGVYRITQRNVRRKIERQRDHRKLSLVIDCQRRGARLKLGEGAQRNLLARGRLHVDIFELIGICWNCGFTSRIT